MIYERIEKSLNRAIKLHNSGLSANESVIKVARENELNPETISRVVEAFNIAKTKAYVKLAQDKAADFDIADKKEIIRATFSEDSISKTASEESVAPASDIFRFEIASKEPREEFVISRTSEVPLASRIKMAFQAMEEQNRVLGEKRQEVIESKENFYNGLKEASEILSFSIEREKVADYAAEIFYQHDGNEKAGKIFSLICKCAGIDSDDLTDKLGGAQDYTRSAFIESFEKMLEADERYTFTAGQFNEQLRDSNEKQAELKSLVYRSGNIANDKSASDLLWGGSSKPRKGAKFSEFPEDLINDVLGSLFDEPKKVASEAPAESVSSMLKLSDITDIVEASPKLLSSFSDVSPVGGKAVQDLASKGYIQKLQGKGSPIQEQRAKSEMENIQRESILRELLRDDIISQQDPEEVASAYNTMMQLAPNASMIKDIARSVLRQGTAQVIDPHFANTLVDLENNILKTKGLVTGSGDKKN